MSKAKLSREEEILLQGFSSNVSKKGSFIFYTIAAIVSVTPVYLYYGIHQMEATESWMIWLVAVAASTFLLGTAYSNTKQNLKHQIIVKRGEAIAREVSKQLADDKKISKLEKDERILWKKSEVGDYEATAFSFFFNNALFHATFLVLSFFLLATLSPAINCVGSFVGASGLAALLSTSKTVCTVSSSGTLPQNFEAEAHKKGLSESDVRLNSLLLPAGIPGPEGNKGICPKYCALDGGVFFEDGTYSFLL